MIKKAKSRSSFSGVRKHNFRYAVDRLGLELEVVTALIIKYLTALLTYSQI